MSRLNNKYLNKFCSLTMMDLGMEIYTKLKISDT